MNIKGRAARFRTLLVSGQLQQERPQMALCMGWALNFFLGLVMACATILNQCGPFGIAVVAQAGGGMEGLLCALGASLGYLLSFGFERGIKYMAAVVLVFTASYVFQELKVYRKAWFMPLIASLFMLLAGFLGALDRLVSPSVLAVGMMTETILAGGACYFFREALSREERSTESAQLRRGISLVIFLSVMMIALTRVELAGAISLGRLTALLIIMAGAFKGGALSGAASGAALGLAMDIAAGGAPAYSSAYAFGGLVSGLFFRSSRLVYVLSFILTNTAAVIWNGNSGALPTALYECFAASVIFLLVPGKSLNYVGAFLRPEQLGGGEAGLRRYTAGRIHKMSEAFEDLHRTVEEAVGDVRSDEDISTVFDNASRTVCSKCKHKSECWHKNYMDTLAVFNDLSPVISSRGLVTEENLPEHFKEKCLFPRELVAAVNAELRARMYRQRLKNRLSENRSAAYQQYSDMAEILREISEELLNAYGPDVLAQRRLQRYLSGMDIDAEAAVFRDRSGRLHIQLESTLLRKLTADRTYLDKLSAVVGVRLCRPREDGESEGRMTLLEAEPLSVSVGIASMKKKGEKVSGDRGTYFKTDRGTLCIILSDGMGSGDDAAKESVAAVRILERFLRSGVEPELAMKMLNSMMLLKNGEEWGFATVDLMCIDLFSGETGFYKYGAAPSYVRSGRMVRRVRSESLAAGLTAGEGAAPDVVKMRLKPGNLALIASDGVIAGTDDGWIRNILCGNEMQDTKALARQTLQTAIRQYGCSDDMTVLAVHINSRE